MAVFELVPWNFYGVLVVGAAVAVVEEGVGMRERLWRLPEFGWRALVRIESRCWTLDDYASKDWWWM